MNIIGCDFHSRMKVIAMLDTRVAQTLSLNVCDQRS